MEIFNSNDNKKQSDRNQNQEPTWVPIPGEELFFSEKEEDEKGENYRDPAQKPNTGDWDDENEREEKETDENLGNDNSGGAGSSGSASTNS
ncbi:hypothetical protein [Flavobacterium ustbae]|uniref:hypothetical protein n=1 Tax=Flavobacterium ustbae TaxID=2488790 RepID=UPI000F770531|nr:hypothetical protein [Flavobacterium ustbae]